MQNIGADNAGDAFYRYKMPKLVAKIEGRGNGIKTNVVNNVEIAKALARPPGYVIKYFGCELGAQTTYVEDLGTSIVNGAHDQKKLSELLEGFIKKYVQCYDCGNPETTIKVSKKDDISLKCKACGAVSNVDPRHKLNTFILKNPPENKLSKEERRLKKVEEERLDGAMQVPDSKDKKEKKKKDKDGKDGKDGKEKKDRKKKKSDEKDDKDKKADASPQDDEDEDEDEEEDDGVVWMTDTSAEAVRKRAEEQLSNATAALVTVVDVEAEEEERRKKEAARKAQQEQEEEEERRKAEEAAAAEALARKAAVVLTLDDIPADRVDAARAIELLRGFPMDDHAMLVKAVRKLNVEGGLAGKMRALYEALLPRAEGHMYLQMKALLPVFEEFAGDPQGQLAQLIALEYLLAEAVPEKLKETAKLLETMYKHDLADGEVIVAWYEKEDAAKILGGSVAGAEAVRAAAKPVYEFLLQEESDEDDDE